MAEKETRAAEGTSPGDSGQEPGDGKGSGGGAADTIAHELRQAVRDAALEVLGPAARQATSSAAKYAVRKGPDLVTKNVMPAVSKAGGAGGLAEQAMSMGGQVLSGSGGIGGMAGKLLSKIGGRGGGAATGWGKGRRMPVQQHVYVSVPVRHAYDGWTEYKQWPKYMHRANQADVQVNDREARVKVTEKMWGFKRPFTAEVVTQLPDQRIKWNATEGVKHTGVINFHEVGPRLTLIEVNVDHSPSGPLEKVARGARFVKRAVRADFHRFQAWIEMKDDDELEELEGWRGTIEGGQIVKSHEEAMEEQQREEEGEEPETEPEGEAGAEPQAGEEGEPEDDSGEEDRGAADEEPEADAGEEEPSGPRRPARPRPRARPQAAARRRPAEAGKDAPEASSTRPKPRRRPARERPSR
jgi:uncharacterized membrane protein